MAKKIVYSCFLLFIMGLIGLIFWEQELKYSKPTPIPENLKTVLKGDTVIVPGIDLTQNFTYIHFYNYDCPCSRFNIKEFEKIVWEFEDKVKFYAVLSTSDEDKEAIKRFKQKYDLGIKVIDDPEAKIASELGVYSTPQAVILNKNQVYYKGNYNKARFCMTQNTRFAQLALQSATRNEPLPDFPDVAEVPYGCEIEKEQKTQISLLNIFK